MKREERGDEKERKHAFGFFSLFVFFRFNFPGTEITALGLYWLANRTCTDVSREHGSDAMRWCINQSIINE